MYGPCRRCPCWWPRRGGSPSQWGWSSCCCRLRVLGCIVGLDVVGLLVIGFHVVGLLVLGCVVGLDVVGLLVIGLFVIGHHVGAAMGEVIGLIKFLFMVGPLITLTQAMAPSSPCDSTWQWSTMWPPKSAMWKRTMQIPIEIVSYHSPSLKWFRPGVSSSPQPPGVTTCTWYTWR
jgi:hypothetical protein